METLLLFVIVLLSIAICTLGGIWFYRVEHARKQSAKPPQYARRPARHGRWEEALHASRDRI